MGQLPHSWLLKSNCTFGWLLFKISRVLTTFGMCFPFPNAYTSVLLLIFYASESEYSLALLPLIYRILSGLVSSSSKSIFRVCFYFVGIGFSLYFFSASSFFLSIFSLFFCFLPPVDSRVLFSAVYYIFIGLIQATRNNSDLDSNILFSSI